MDIIGGYRLIRRLGAGERAEVFLGHADLTDSAQGATAAVKIYRPGVDQLSIDNEVAVLSRCSSRHLVQLTDVATGPLGRQCLVLARLAGGSLSRLLADRQTFDEGEVVTILAPLAEAIATLHDARCVHGALRSGAVFFDETGAPVLARFGRASTLDLVPGDHDVRRATVAELQAAPGVAGDLEHLRTLAKTLLARCTPGTSTSRGVELMEWLGAAEREAEAPTFARELSSRLFTLARAIPVRLEQTRMPGRGPQAQANYTNLIADTKSIAPQSDRSNTEEATENPSIVARILRRVLATARPQEFVRREGAAQLDPRGTALFRRAVAAIAAVRRPFRVAAGAGLVAVVLAALLMPSTAGSPEADTAAAAVKNGNPLPAPRSETRPSQVPDAAALVTVAASNEAKKISDDPVTAAAALLADRQRCIRKLSVDCLDSVDQRGSSAWDDDSYLIRLLQEGGAPAAVSLVDRTLVLAERLGDSALLTVEAAADAEAQSILIMKGESGWRIRDILAG